MGLLEYVWPLQKHKKTQKKKMRRSFGSILRDQVDE
jgi:hypothetical protein